jgi:hypothetical protein
MDKNVIIERNLIFKKIDGEVINDVNNYVNNFIKENPYTDVTIGCDSQEHSKYIKYAVVIVMHKMDKYGAGHGAHVINSTYMDYSKTMKSDIYSKLWVEAELTIQTAQMLNLKNYTKNIKIHLDYNSNEEEYSNVLYSSGMGFVKGMGFEAYGKPYAWAASSVADRNCR